MVTSGYEEIDHIADLAIRVWGEDIFAIMRQSARGMYAFMNVVSNRDAAIKLTIPIQKSLSEIMLIDFLSELLYLSEDQKIIFEEFNFSDEGDEIVITAVGHQAESITRNIKAVTYHNLELIACQNGFETTITFDV